MSQNTSVYEGESQQQLDDDWGISSNSITLPQPELQTSPRRCITLIHYLQDIIIDSKLLESQPLFTTWTPTVSLWNFDLSLLLLVLLVPILRKLLLPVAVYILCGSGRNTAKNLNLLQQFKTFIKSTKSFDNYAVKQLKYFQEIDLITGGDHTYKQQLRRTVMTQFQALAIRSMVFANNCVPFVDQKLLSMNFESYDLDQYYMSYDLDQYYMPHFDMDQFDTPNLKAGYRQFLTARKYLLCTILSIDSNKVGYTTTLLNHLEGYLQLQRSVQFTITNPQDKQDIEDDVPAKRVSQIDFDNLKSLEDIIENLKLHLEIMEKNTDDKRYSQELRKSFCAELDMLDSKWSNYLSTADLESEDEYDQHSLPSGDLDLKREEDYLKQAESYILQSEVDYPPHVKSAKLNRDERIAIMRARRVSLQEPIQEPIQHPDLFSEELEQILKGRHVQY